MMPGARVRIPGPLDRRLSTLLGVVAPLALLAGCSGSLEQAVDDVIPKREPLYKSSSSLPPLEVPPDLSRSTLNDTLVVPEGAAPGTTYSAYENASASAGPVGTVETGVLPRLSNVHVERSGDERWLVVDAPPAQVWPRVREFWLAQGFLLVMDDPSIGIMETDWAEKRTNFRSGAIEKLLGTLTTALYGTASRDKFRTRLERGAEPETTEIYISHRGAEEVRETLDVRTGAEAKVWEPRPGDPELEAEMLNRLMLSFGIEQQQADRMIADTRSQRDRAQLVRENGTPALALQEDFSRAWRRTGLALDRVGFTVEDRDRSRGLFYVRYVDPDKDLGNDEKGFLSKLKFWGGEDAPKDAAYLISLVGGGQTTQVVVLDKEGRPEVSQTADRILGLLHEQLR